jgi:hypothetical protein
MMPIIVEGSWISANSLNSTFSDLAHFSMSHYPIPEKAYLQEIPDIAPIERRTITPVLNDFFSVYDADEMQNRIDAIKQRMLEEQNLHYQMGRCLRSFTQKVSVPLSKMACGLVQMLDIHYMRVSFAFKRFQRCYEGEQSTFCEQIKQAGWIEDVEREYREEIVPAQNLVADALGFESDRLFKREEIRQSWI